MSNRFHNKFHRQNHHSISIAGYPDSSLDPIASYEQPFQGEFYSQGNIITTENLSAGNNLIVGNDGLINGDLTIKGNFSVYGTTSELDTRVYVTSALSVTNTGTGPAAVFKQTGNQPVAQFYDDNDTALFIDGRSATPGYIGIGTNSPNEKLHVIGNARITGTAAVETINNNITSDLVLVVGPNDVIQKRTIDSSSWNSSQTYVELAGDSMTGKLTLDGNPVNNLHAATKQYVDTQVGLKQNIITGAATTIDTEDLTASRALISNASGKVAVSNITSAELDYLNNVTSNIQTQLNNKQNNLGFTPVQQGGGGGQGTNKTYVGWLGSRLGLQIDTTNFGADWPINITGMVKPIAVQPTVASTTALSNTTNDIELNASSPVTINAFSGGIAKATYTVTNIGSANITITSNSTIITRGGSTWNSHVCGISPVYSNIILTPNSSCSLRVATSGSPSTVSVW